MTTECLRNTPPRRWWQRRWMKISVLTTLIGFAALYTIEPAIGERMWRNYQTEAAAKGVKLRYEDYETPPIPDEENYAAAPIFKGLVDSDEGAGAVCKLFELPQLTSRPKLRPLDLTAWQARFLRAGWIDTPSADAANDVLTALVRISGPLEEVRQASSRPKTRWPNDFEALRKEKFRPAQALQTITFAFGLRARALLASDHPDEALAELHHMARISESLSDPPLMARAITHGAIWNMILQVVEEGLKANRWRSSQLAGLTDLIQGKNHLSHWKLALSSERCFLNDYFNRLATAGPITFIGEYRGFLGEKPIALMLAAGPRGWVRKNQIELNELIDLDVAGIDTTHHIVHSQFSRSASILEAQSRIGSLRLSRQVARLWLTSVESGSYWAFRRESFAQQLTILCALVRYRTINGGLPESLDALVPHFIAAVPHDIMDGKPMRYRRTDEGGCVVWSIASNRCDDGGTIGKNNRSAYQQLDWITELPPLATE